MANIYSPLLRQAWDAFQRGSSIQDMQDLLTNLRKILDLYPPMPPLLKELLHRLNNFPSWPVRAPLVSFPEAKIHEVIDSLAALSA
jgi:dihydrodipicolinate synthase/N-acetylneuraminate lyase